ncbi:MAG: tetratricopeptide repeat protein [bacterium]|nr:tetratricopeptide repeat protein [bacterium]
MKIIIYEKKIFLFAFFLISTTSFSQQQEIDSLSLAFENVVNDSLKAKILSDIVMEAYSFDLHFAKKMNDSLISFSKGKNKKYLSQGLRMRGTFQLLEGEYDLSLQSYENALKIAKSIKDYEIEALVNSNLGTFYGRKQEPDTAIVFYKKSIEIIRENNLKTNYLINPYINLGITIGLQNNLEKAISYLIYALKYAEEHDSEQIIFVYNQIAVNFLKLKEFAKAEAYLLKALPIAEKLEDNYGLAGLHNSLGYLNETRDDNFIKALDHYQKSNFYHERMSNKREWATSYFNIGLQHLRLNKTKLAFSNFTKAIKISDSLGSSDLQIIGLYYLAEYYAATANVAAMDSTLSRVESILYNKSKIEHKDHYYRISQFLQRSGSSKEAFKYVEHYAILLDSMHQLNNVKSLADIETKYQTEKTANENLTLKKKNAEQDLVVQQATNLNQRYGFIALIAFLGIFGSIYYAKTRRRKLRDEHIINIAQTKQKEHEKIGADLHSTKAKDLEKIASALEEKGEAAIALKVRDVKDSIRLLSHELFQIPFSQLEFDDQIINLLFDYNSASLKITHAGMHTIPWSQVDDTIKRNLYLIISEAISNVKNHSKASAANVKFQKTNKNIDITITDNGIGFTEEDLKKGHGIGNMRMRVNDIKGSIRFDAVKNKGCEIGIFITAF